MRKLVFMLKVNPNPRSTAPKNLEISTHKGARLTIIGNQATVLDVTNDEMSDSELQNWYRSRYSGLGMGISILHDPEVKVLHVNEPEKVSKPKRQSKKAVEKKQEVPVENETVEVSQVQQVAKVVPKEPETENNSDSSVGDVADLQSFLWS